MVLFVMTRTRLARTAGRSVTASMIALTSRISPPALSVACVVMRATWLVIVPTGNAARTGVMMGLETGQPDASAEGRLTRTTRYVWHRKRQDFPQQEMRTDKHV